MIKKNALPQQHRKLYTTKTAFLMCSVTCCESTCKSVQFLKPELTASEANKNGVLNSFNSCLALGWIALTKYGQQPSRQLTPETTGPIFRPVSACLPVKTLATKAACLSTKGLVGWVKWKTASLAVPEWCFYFLLFSVKFVPWSFFDLKWSS